MYTIEKDVPLPRSQGNTPSGSTIERRETMQALEVMESFVIPLMGRGVGTLVAYTSADAKRFLPKRFKTARVADGIRVWRIE